MEKVLKILLLEDSIADAELIAFELRRTSGRCEIKRVETKAAFLETLKNFNPSLILADYILPTFDAMSALKLAREHAPSIPFIIVTGSISEEVAVESMKAGAWDYVLKDHLARLIPAIKGALEKKLAFIQKQKAEQEARKAAEDTSQGGSAVAETVEAMRKIAQQISIVDDIAVKPDEKPNSTFSATEPKIPIGIIHRAPHLSPNCPLRNCPIPYAMKNALPIIPTSVFEKSNAFIIPGNATAIFARHK